MSTHPVVYAKAKVLGPAMALSSHIKIQQHIAMLSQEPDYRHNSAIVVLREDDLKRLFQDMQVREFYILESGVVSYVTMRQDTSSDGEVFATMIAMNQQVLSAILGDMRKFVDDFYKEHPTLPDLRMKLLMQGESGTPTAITNRVHVIDMDTYTRTNAMLKFDEQTVQWVPNDEEITPIGQKKRLHLKDIPLTTRSGRQLVRNSIVEYADTLHDSHRKSGSALNFDDWMTQNQGVCMKALHELEAIDKLPDDKYVEALVTFKRAEAQAYHSQAVKDKLTELHLFDWTLETFGEEFNDLGRREAMAEIVNLDEPTQNLGEVDHINSQDDTPATFLVSFDGTIVEDQHPQIGPESPFATLALKRLIEKGHNVFILSHRTKAARDTMWEFLKSAGVDAIGSTTSMPASGILKSTSSSMHIENATESEWEVDYLIDQRLFGATTVQISGRATGGSTLYWGDLVSELMETGYLTSEDLDEIMASVSLESQQ